MATDKMYELAFQYKRTKLWKNMLETEAFAVRLSDGEIGYCCVTGLMGDDISLSVYVGDEGFQSLRELGFHESVDFSEPSFASAMMNASWAFRQVCLQCSFENREDLDEWDAEEVRKYAKAHQIHLRGPHSFPNFTKYMRYRIPMEVETPEDRRRICDALSAATALAELLKTKSKADIGLSRMTEDTETLPLLAPENGGYALSRTKVPPEWEESWPDPGETDEESVEELRKLRKRGVYACELFRLPGLLEGQMDGGGAPYFPILLLCVDTRSGYIVGTNPVTDYDTHPQSLRDAFIQTLVKNGECPRAIKVRDEQARVLLGNLCMKAGILLSVDGDLPALDEAREEILRMLHMDGGFFDDDEEDEDDETFSNDDTDEMDMDEAISMVVDQLMRMSDQELKSLPPMVARQILDMAPFGFVPQELQLRLRRLFKK